MLNLLAQIGGCVLYHDYRSGSFRDWSGAGNDGTPTLAGLTRGGADFHAQSKLVTVPYASGLDLGGGSALSVVVIGNDVFKAVDTTAPRFCEQSSGFGFLVQNDGSYLRLQIGVSEASLAGVTSITTVSKSFGVNWTNGSAPNFYTDGVYRGDGHQSLSSSSNTSDIVVGNRAALNRAFAQTMSAICFFNKALSATEHAQVYDALRAMKWPTKATGRGTNRIGVESDCVAGYNMRPVAGKVFDMSGNGNHGAILRGKSLNTVMGPALSFIDSDDLGVNCGSDASTNLTGAMTLSGWVFKPDITAQTYMIRRDNYGVSLVGAGAVNLVYFYTRNAADTGSDANALSVDFDPGNWVHFAAVFDPIAQTKVVYANGVAGTPVSKTDGGVPSSPASDLLLGTNGSATFPGVLRNVQIFNVAKDADWVMSEYQKGARQVTFKTDFGARETIAAVGAPSKLTNTPWEVVSGTHEIITTTINGTPVKAIRCVTAGRVAIPASLFRVGEAGAARGGFKFWVYIGVAGNTPRLAFVGNQTSRPFDAGFDGYAIRFLNSETFEIREFTNGVATSLMASPSTLLASDRWNEFEVTVGDGGVITAYMDGQIIDVSGGTGANPVTDASHTTSKFLVLDPDAGDMLALGSVDGEYALEKILGVSNAR